MDPAPRPRRWRRPAGVTLGLAAFAAIVLIPSGLHSVEGYGDRPAYAAAIAALMAIWWFSEALPIGWTACVPLVAFPLLDVFGGGVGDSAVRSASAYVDGYIFLFMGGMAIGAAMEQWNLHRRIALHIMQRVGTDPRRLLLGMLVATASVSLWISNTATAVMMVPIGVALVRQLELQSGEARLSGFGAALMLSVAYAANIGGLGTKIGTPANSLYAGFVAERLDYDVGFLQFIAIGLPVVLVLIPICWLVLWRLARNEPLGKAQGAEVIARELDKLGGFGRQERRVAIVFAAAALLWMMGGPIRDLLAPGVADAFGVKLSGKYYEAGVAMLGALVLVAVGALPWAAIRRVPWSALLLLGGSFALAAGIEGSGLSVWMTRRLGGLSELPPLGQHALASSSTILLSALASNTATVNVMLNVLPASLPVLTTATLASSCDFALPAGTPPNAIVFGSGYVRLPTMMKFGVLLDLICAVFLALYGWLVISRLV